MLLGQYLLFSWCTSLITGYISGECIFSLWVSASGRSSLLALLLSSIQSILVGMNHQGWKIGRGLPDIGPPQCERCRDILFGRRRSSFSKLQVARDGPSPSQTAKHVFRFSVFSLSSRRTNGVFQAFLRACVA